MAKYTYNCDMGHENEVMEVEADNDDMAVEMLMGKVKAHLSEKHSEMAEMSDDDMKKQIMDNWSRTE